MSPRIASQRTALLGKTRSCFLVFIVLSSLASAHAQTGASTPALHPAVWMLSKRRHLLKQSLNRQLMRPPRMPHRILSPQPLACRSKNNTYYDVGPYRRAENVLLVEAVIPFKLSQNWIVISRTITPVEVVPRISSAEGVDYGLGNIQPRFYLSPSHPGKFIWGAGAQLGYSCSSRRRL
jgi:hypothetical protein